MPDYVTAALSAIGVLVVLGILYLIWKKWWSPPDQREATEETKESLRLENEEISNSERVGLFNRTRAQPTTTKLFYTSLVVLFGVLGFGAYSLLQSGTPQEMAYADQLTQLVFGTVIATGVVWFVRKQDRKAGKLRVILENESTSAKEIPFDWGMAEPATAANQDNDVCLAPAFKKNRLLGLFWRVNLVGDNPDARGLDKSQPQDRVMYEVPMDESTTWDYRNRTVTVRAQDTVPYENANSAATYRFVPSDRASKGELEDKKETIAELEEEVDRLEQMDAIKDERIEGLEEYVKNMEHGSDQEFEDAMQTVLQLLAALNGRQQFGGDVGDQGGALKQAQQAAGAVPSKNGAAETTD